MTLRLQALLGCVNRAIKNLVVANPYNHAATESCIEGLPTMKAGKSLLVECKACKYEVFGTNPILAQKYVLFFQVNLSSRRNDVIHIKKKK